MIKKYIKTLIFCMVFANINAPASSSSGLQRGTGRQTSRYSETLFDYIESIKGLLERLGTREGFTYESLHARFEVDEEADRVIKLREGADTEALIVPLDKDAPKGTSDDIVVYLFNHLFYLVRFKAGAVGTLPNIEPTPEEFRGYLQKLAASDFVLDKHQAIVSQDNLRINVWESVQCMGIGTRANSTALCRFNNYPPRRIPGFLPVTIGSRPLISDNPEHIGLVENLKAKQRKNLAELDFHHNNQECVMSQSYAILKGYIVFEQSYKYCSGTDITYHAKKEEPIIVYCFEDELLEMTQEILSLEGFKTHKIQFGIYNLAFESGRGKARIFYLYIVPVNSASVQSKCNIPYYSFSIVLSDDLATINQTLAAEYIRAYEMAKELSAKQEKWATCKIIQRDDELHFLAISYSDIIKSKKTHETLDPIASRFESLRLGLGQEVLGPAKFKVVYSGMTCPWRIFARIEDVFAELRKAGICKRRVEYIASSKLPTEEDGKYFVNGTGVTLTDPFRLIHDTGTVEYYFQIDPTATTRAPEVAAAAAVAPIVPGHVVVERPSLRLSRRMEPTVMPFDLPADIPQDIPHSGNDWSCRLIHDEKYVLARFRGSYSLPYSTAFTSLVEESYTNILRVNQAIALESEEAPMSREELIKTVNKLIGRNYQTYDVFPRKGYANPTVRLIVRKGETGTDREVFLIITGNGGTGKSLVYRLFPSTSPEEIDIVLE